MTDSQTIMACQVEFNLIRYVLLKIEKTHSDFLYLYQIFFVTDEPNSK